MLTDTEYHKDIISSVQIDMQAIVTVVTLL